MNELKDELFGAPSCEWRHVPITENHHKWWLHWYRLEDNRSFGFSFESPNGRKYFFFVERREDGNQRMIDADVSLANGKTIARYWDSWGDSPERLDAVLRLTPTHVLDRLLVLLDAIG